MRHVFLVGILALGMTAGTAWADRTATSDKPLKVCVEIFKPTSIQYPERILKVNALELPDRYTFEAVGVYFYLTVKQPDFEGRVFLVGETGQQYQVDFAVCQRADVIVRLARPQSSTQAKAQPFSLASWFRALRLNHTIPGQQAADVPLPSLPDTRLAILSSGAVSRGKEIGMILHLSNTTDATLTIDERIGETVPVARADSVSLSQWGWPPRMTVEAVALEEKRLHPGQTTRLYVVFEKR